MLGIGVELRIGLLEKRVGQLARLDVGAVIDKLANRNLEASSAKPPEMIAMPVRDDEVIDLLQSGVFVLGVHDATGGARHQLRQRRHGNR